MRRRWKIAQKAELKWWKNYLGKHESTEYLQWKKSYWIDFLNKIAVHPKKDDICLDAGCGPAGINIVLGNTSFTCVDPLLNSYREQFNAHTVQNEKHQFRQQHLEDLKETAHYDLIFCLNVINHVSDWKLAGQNLWNALKPGGTLVLSTDVHRIPWLKYPFRLFQWDILHPQQHSESDYLHWFKSAFRESALVRNNTLKKTGFFRYQVFVLKKEN
ncbi:MAG: methyltransferase domain-containing protein [Bacteroidetes bacterium]|nr:methyltransferase domain-containing protein [Bacteroidota bacterium]